VIVLGIDPGTAALGWGLIEQTAGRLRAVDHGCLVTSPDLPLSERLLAIHRHVSELIELHDPVVVAVDDSAVHPVARGFPRTCVVEIEDSTLTRRFARRCVSTICSVERLPSGTSSTVWVPTWRSKTLRSRVRDRMVSIARCCVMSVAHELKLQSRM